MTAALHEVTTRFLPPVLEAAGKDLFVYGVEFLPLALSANRQSAQFEVAEDSAFLIVAGAAFKTTSADATLATDMLALVNVYVASSRQQIVQPTQPGGNDPPLENWFGSGQAPMYWSIPKIIRPGETVVVQLTNLEATARNYRLSFLGCHLYRSRVADPWSYFRKDW